MIQIWPERKLEGTTIFTRPASQWERAPANPSIGLGRQEHFKQRIMIDDTFASLAYSTP